MKVLISAHSRSCSSVLSRALGALPVFKNYSMSKLGEIIDPSALNDRDRNYDLIRKVIDQHDSWYFKVIVGTVRTARLEEFMDEADLTFFSARKDLFSATASCLYKLDDEFNGTWTWDKPSWSARPKNYTDLFNGDQNRKDRVQYAFLAEYFRQHELMAIHWNRPDVIHLYSEDLVPGYKNPRIRSIFGQDLDLSQVVRPSHYTELFYDHHLMMKSVQDMLGVNWDNTNPFGVSPRF